MANRRKGVKKEIVEKRPELMEGNEKAIIARNLAELQKLSGLTNDDMADAFGVDSTQYQRLKSGKCALTNDKLQILYYNFGADLNRLIANDTSYPYFRSNVSSPHEGDFNDAVKKLMLDVEHTNGGDERRVKIMEIYAALGEMIEAIADYSREK